MLESLTRTVYDFFITLIFYFIYFFVNTNYINSIIIFVFLLIQIEDNLWNSLSDPYIGMSMAMTAENLAEKYGITREEADEYALLSHQRWKAGKFGHLCFYECIIEVMKLSNFYC